MKKIYQFFVIITALLLLTVITPNKTIFASSSSIVITKNENDINPIPDKYNTGAKEPEGGFQAVELGGSFSCTHDGEPATVKFSVSGGEKNTLNLGYANKNMTGTYIIENVDFSSAPIYINHEGDWDKKATSSGEQLKFIFSNCKFKSFSTSKYSYTNISYEFNTCSFQSIYGSNTTLNRCYFGGGYGDRINPFSNFYANYCYIANPTYYGTIDGTVHLDGVQLWGDNTNHLDIHDVYFDNCRFEIPAYKYPNCPKVSVNACIMLQLEFSSGYNIAFTNCILNGGGYAVYARTTSPQYSLTNVKFENITVGGGRKWGMIYPDKSNSIDFNMDTWKETDSLYVGSVWRNQTTTSFSVTNDTTKERQLIVYTSSGKSYNFTIAACPAGKQISTTTFDDFPFDVEYQVPERVKWLVVYEIKTDDTTGTKSLEQIRYQTFYDATKTTLLAKPNVSSDNQLSFELEENPSKTKITKLISKKKNIVVKWKKKKNIDGYEIQYSTSKKFKKHVKTKKIKSSKKIKTTLKKLKRKTKYYVRIRCYKTLNTRPNKYTLYSAWSKTKKISTK